MSGWRIAELSAVAPTLADESYWTSTELLVRIGLPLLLVAVGVGMVIWGRRERAEAHHQLAVRSRFPMVSTSPESPRSAGGRANAAPPPHPVDYDENAPDPQSGRGKILAGTGAAVVGAGVLVVVTAVRVLSG